MLKTQQIRIMIADDHSVVRFGIAAIVSSGRDMAVVAQAANGTESGGADGIRIVRSEEPKARFIVLTTYQGEEDTRRALIAGASACLLKGMSHSEPLNALDVVYSGCRYFPQSVLYTLNAAGRTPN